MRSQISMEAEARFNAIVEEYGRRLRRLIIQLCPKDLGIQFDDLEQEARLRLWRAVQREKEIPKLSSYIYRIAMTTMIDAVREVKARREEQLHLAEPGESKEEFGELASLTMDPEHSPERVAERQQVIQRVEAAMARLPENRRRVVALHLQELDIQGIADRLQWSQPKVRNLIYRGLDELREQLRLEGIEYG